MPKWNKGRHAWKLIASFKCYHCKHCGVLCDEDCEFCWGEHTRHYYCVLCGAENGYGEKRSKEKTYCKGTR